MEPPKRLLHISPLWHWLRQPTPSTRNLCPQLSQPSQHPYIHSSPATAASPYTPLPSTTFAPKQAPLRKPLYAQPPPPSTSIDPNAYTILGTSPPGLAALCHHFHVYATKHNTHITFTDTQRVPLISVSCGSIGFRKAQRGTYDAAYQLGGYMLSRIQEQGLLPQIERCELVFRGFGPGREALAKILAGAEGGAMRGKWVRVVDATRLKFGGQRSKKPRRLG